MPRKRLTQAPKTAGGQYGDQTRLRDAQAHMPLPGPDMPPGGSTAVPAPGPGGLPTGGVAPAPPPSPVEAATAFDGEAVTSQLTPLSAPSTRPMEPITSGLPMGLGPGPRPFNPNTAANAMSLLAEKTGDPAISALAQLAYQQGL